MKDPDTTSHACISLTVAWPLCIGFILTSILTVPSVFADLVESHSHSGDLDRRLTPRAAKTHVTGTLPPSEPDPTTTDTVVKSEIREGYRYVSTNGIPDHETGRFPNRGNPNVIGEQDYHFRIPFDPAPPAYPVDKIELVHTDRGYLFGIALNGSPHP